MIQNTTEQDTGIIYLKNANRARMKIQERECRKEMRENGIQVSGVFCDIDSGIKEQPGIRQAIQYCEANPVDFVVVYDSRNFGDSEDKVSATFNNFYIRGTEPLFMYGDWDLE